MYTGNTETGITVTYDDVNNELDFIAADVSPTNEIELPAGGTNGQVLETDGSGNYTWVNQTSGADGVIQTHTVTGTTTKTSTITRSVGGNIVETWTDLTLTQEQAQDFIGTMVSGNTEEGITVTYDDAANEFDFINTEASQGAFKNHADAGTGGVSIGEYFHASTDNTMGMTPGTKIKRMF